MMFTGKNCLVTGASTGLGLAVSKKMAHMGAHTILLCRNKEKGAKAVQEIKQSMPNASIDLMICDLSSMTSIHGFIDAFKAKYSKLDILYNNAAVMKQKCMLTEDGFEMMFQVNYLAPFMLMKAFWGLLKNGSTPYIINNTRPEDKHRLDLDDLQSLKDYHMYQSFFKTKLCLLFAGLALSRRYDRDGIAVTMIDPGLFKSDLVRDMPIMGWVKNLFSAPVDKAAENILYHIKADEAPKKNGKVFKQKQEEPLTEYWQDIGVREHLWAVTQSLINGNR